MMKIDIELVPRDHQHDIGDAFFRFPHVGQRFHAKLFGLTAGSNQTGGVGEHRHHADRSTAKLRPILLLAGREVGIEIDEQGVEGHAGRDGLSSGAPTHIHSRNVGVREKQAHHLLNALLVINVKTIEHRTVDVEHADHFIVNDQGHHEFRI